MLVREKIIKRAGRRLCRGVKHGIALIFALFSFHFLFAQSASPSQPPSDTVKKSHKNTPSYDKRLGDTTYVIAPKFFIGGAIGIGIPGLNYGRADSIGNNDHSHITGYAKTGFQFNLNAGYYFNENTGIMVQFGQDINGFNSTAYQTAESLPNYNNFTVSATSQKVGSYLVGVVLNLPQGVATTKPPLGGKGWSCNFHLLAGLLTAHYSTITAGYVDTAKVSHSTVTSIQTGNSLAVDLGTGITYHFNHLIGADFNIDYMMANPVFNNYTVTQSGGSTQTYNENTAMSLSLFNVSVGIVITP